ncbi:MAG: AAA-like domain-containing protein [Bacteroides sp.]|nr:AAA-like domain-containing protein [Bacteroides sp.]MCM1085226.1 AAA-like domain-containing protein [Bacteroides sp.]MCM1169954.1 AAA-like domain-containing protein [Bacteroides sp.]
MDELNPFLISGYDKPEHFCDRQKETKSILNALKNGRDITLISPRRMGKTGLIKHTLYQAKAQNPEIKAFYIDIYPTQNLNDFVRLFAATILGELDSASKKIWKQIGNFIKSFRPVLNFNELTGLPQVSVEMKAGAEETGLKEIFEYLKSSGKTCYIAIDEFQQIAEYPEAGVEALLRSYIQFIPNVHFIFSGSKQHVMHEMFMSAKKPFYQSTQTLTLDRINQKVYYSFAAGFFPARRPLPQEVFDLIYRRFEGHTWYMQCMLNRLYGYSGAINEKTVRRALSEIVAESAYFYESLLAAYPAGINRLLKAIADEGCVKEILAGEFIARHNLKAASSVSTLVKKAVNNELVYRTPEGYIVYDRFMAEWLKNRVF